MTKLLGGQIGLDDFIFVHRKGEYCGSAREQSMFSVMRNVLSLHSHNNFICPLQGSTINIFTVPLCSTGNIDLFQDNGLLVFLLPLVMESIL